MIGEFNAVEISLYEQNTIEITTSPYRRSYGIKSVEVLRERCGYVILISYSDVGSKRTEKNKYKTRHSVIQDLQASVHEKY